MSENITIKGVESVQNRLKQIGSTVTSRVDQQVGQIADEVLRRSKLQVPKDVGTLEKSGSARRVKEAEHEVGFHTPYAHRLHEHPEYQFQGGRKGKYLEDPLKEIVSEVGGKIGREIKRG